MSHETRTFVSPGTVGLVACLAMHALSPHAALAQLSSAIDLSSRTARPSVGGWQRQLSLSPFARFDHPRLMVDARWTAFGGNGERLDGTGNFSATYFSPTRAGLQLSVEGFADRTLLSEAFPVSRFGADARLSYRYGSAGAWLG